MNKKRKVVSQQISKFFKTENLKKRKIAVIGVDDINNNDKSDESSKGQIGSKKGLKEQNTVGVAVTKCVQKLQIFHAESGNATCTNSMVDSKLYGSTKVSESLNNIKKLPCLEASTNSNHDNADFTNLQQLSRIIYTPLESQVLKIKADHPDLLLFVECGYKYRFFGKDAEIAAEELNICKNIDHNFMTASIPVHRLHIHMSRLLESGYKVGVVMQTETSALKAMSNNKNAPFSRQLTHIYTKATFLNVQEGNIMTKKDTGDFICSVSEDKGSFSVLLVNPATCDLVYDMNMDTNGLNSIFHVLKPCEVVTRTCGLNKAAEDIMNSYKTDKTILRIERLSYNNSDSLNMFFDNLKVDPSLKDCVCLMYTYLAQFQLEKILAFSTGYRSFHSNKSSMKLDYTCIQNLELFKNNWNNKIDGSLFSVIDHTKSAFGNRLLMKWLREPLTDVKEINKRLEAVNELKTTLHLKCIHDICKTLHMSIDLEKGLSLIYNHRCAPKQFLNICESLENTRTLFVRYKEEFMSNFKSELILDLCSKVPDLLGKKISEFLKKLNKHEIVNGTKVGIFTNTINYPRLHKCVQEIKNIEDLLALHLSTDIRRVLGNRALEYKTISGVEYLIEVRNADANSLPEDWIKVSATKQFSRIRTPFIEENFHKLLCLRETLLIAANEAWDDLLLQFKDIYNECRNVVYLLSTLDCLVSLAIVANGVGYVRPEFTENTIMIKDGRHPIIETFLTNQFVSNDTCLHENEKVMLIFGPNMGGKSSYVKQVALCCIMAQIGCYVPASSACLSILDGIYCRMGASDKIARGKSTFMVELEEASYIMKNATRNSLVIFDELGRGTSTHDGTAIAYATLKHFIEEIQSFLLFVTHYPTLSELKYKYSDCLNLYHMTFMDSEQESNTIVLLYKLIKGEANRSYGLNVARLAGIDESIIKNAALKSSELEENATKKRLIRSVFTQSQSSDRLLALRFVQFQLPL